MSHSGSKWVTVERSGRFWVVIQGKGEWKKIKEVRHLLECSMTNSVGKETNQFDETGVGSMCRDTTTVTTLS